MTTGEMNYLTETFNNIKAIKDEDKKNWHLTQLMAYMEHEYNIPVVREKAWECEYMPPIIIGENYERHNPCVTAMYRAVSEARVYLNK